MSKSFFLCVSLFVSEHLFLTTTRTTPLLTADFLAKLLPLRLDLAFFFF
jgi:hypothetical protein